jgi:biopolymer transport protein ExbD
MAFSANHGNGGFTPRRGRRFSSLSPNSEINVVPLVDVVLVLLIIFMITANVMEFGLDIQVPEVAQVKSTTQDLPVIGITKAGESYLNGRPVNINALSESIHARFHSATAVYVQADKETPWDPIAQVVAKLGAAHFEVKMVTKPGNSSRRR